MKGIGGEPPWQRDHAKLVMPMQGSKALREEMLRDESIVYLGQGIGPRESHSVKPAAYGTSSVMIASEIHQYASLRQLEWLLARRWLAVAPSSMKSFSNSRSRPRPRLCNSCNVVTHRTGKSKRRSLSDPPMGAVRSAGAHHSHVFYSWFGTIPGLEVVVPSHPIRC